MEACHPWMEPIDITSACACSWFQLYRRSEDSSQADHAKASTCSGPNGVLGVVRRSVCLETLPLYSTASSAPALVLRLDAGLIGVFII